MRFTRGFKTYVSAFLTFILLAQPFNSLPAQAEEEEYDRLNTLFALNLAVVAVKNIVSTKDRIVLEQEYNNIINNYILGNIEADDYLMSLFSEQMNVIKNNLLRDEERKRFQDKYERRQKNAIARAVSTQTVIQRSFASQQEK